MAVVDKQVFLVMERYGIGEEFKEIAGYEGLYSVSNKGRVWSIARCKYLALNGGFVNLYKGGISKKHKIQNLVAAAFMGWSGSVGSGTVRWKDGDSSNNCVGNLYLIQVW